MEWLFKKTRKAERMKTPLSTREVYCSTTTALQTRGGAREGGEGPQRVNRCVVGVGKGGEWEVSDNIQRRRKEQQTWAKVQWLYKGSETRGGLFLHRFESEDKSAAWCGRERERERRGRRGESEREKGKS